MSCLLQPQVTHGHIKADAMQADLHVTSTAAYNLHSFDPAVSKGPANFILVCRGSDMKAVSAPKPDESGAPAAEPHPIQHFFGSDSVHAMRAALGRFGADKQAETDHYSHSKLQMQPLSNAVQTHTTGHDGLTASALGRISGKVCLWSSAWAMPRRVSC